MFIPNYSNLPNYLTTALVTPPPRPCGLWIPPEHYQVSHPHTKTLVDDVKKPVAFFHRWWVDTGGRRRGVDRVKLPRTGRKQIPGF